MGKELNRWWEIWQIFHESGVNLGKNYLINNENRDTVFGNQNLILIDN